MTENATSRLGSWIQTASGLRFWPLNPRADEVRIEDVAHALSLVCRFGGHCRVHYSVAQHSLLVASFVEATHPAVALHALLHDAAEAYVGDVVRQLKPFLHVARADGQQVERFQLTEARVARMIEAAFGLRELSTAERFAIIRADDRALATEARDLMVAPAWGDLPEPDPARIVTMEPAAVEAAFLARYRDLTADKIKCRHCGLLVEADGSDGHYDDAHGVDEDG